MLAKIIGPASTANYIIHITYKMPVPEILSFLFTRERQVLVPVRPLFTQTHIEIGTAKQFIERTLQLLLK